MKHYSSHAYETGPTGTALTTGHILASKNLTKGNLYVLKSFVCALHVLSHLINNSVVYFHYPY